MESVLDLCTNSSLHRIHIYFLQLLSLCLPSVEVVLVYIWSLSVSSRLWFQVVSVIERRADQLDYVLVDTPGQIEIFTWSASGAIITEAFASTFPTVITYVVDTPRSESPVTFMSNMLYACSILYKTRLPLVLAFNKTDVAKHQFALEVCSIFSTVVNGFEVGTTPWFKLLNW